MLGKARPSYFNFYPIGYRQITGRWDPSFSKLADGPLILLGTDASYPNSCHGGGHTAEPSSTHKRHTQQKSKARTDHTRNFRGITILGSHP